MSPWQIRNCLYLCTVNVILRPVILDAVEKSHRYCLVSNSLKCPVQIRENILIASVVE